MKRTILVIAIVGMVLLAGLSVVSAGDITPSTTKTSETPQRDPGPFMRLFIRLFGSGIRAQGKGNYTGPLGEVDFEDISYAFTNEEAVTLISLFGFGLILLNRRHPMEGPHNGEIRWFVGTVTLDDDGTYHIVGRYGGGCWGSES